MELGPGPGFKIFLPHLMQTMKRRLPPPKSTAPGPSPLPPLDKGTFTIGELLTMSGWVTNAQQTTERDSRCSHHTHCTVTNLPRRGVCQHLHESKLPMKTELQSEDAFPAGRHGVCLKRGCGMGTRYVDPSKQNPFLLREHQLPCNFPAPRVKKSEVRTEPRRGAGN